MGRYTHKKYSKQLEDINKTYISGISGISLKYKNSLDELGNIVNIISNGFFNIDAYGKVRDEDAIKAMNTLENTDIQSREKAMQQVQKDIITLKDAIKNDHKIIPSIQSLLLKKIDQTLKMISIISLSIPLEALKYTYTIDPKTYTIIQSQEKKQQLGHLKIGYEKNIKDIERIQTEIYGPKISDVPEEKNLIMNNLGKLLAKNKNTITEEEYAIFSKFIDTFPVPPYISDQKESKNIPMKGSIPATSVKNIANYTINKFYDIPGWKAVTETGKTTLSVSPDKQELHLPANKKSFTELSLSTITEHEIGGHVIRGAKGKKHIGFSGNNYENIEEGLTKLNEYLMHYNTLEDIPVNPEIAHISTFIGENYNFNDTFGLLKIYYKLTGKTNNEANKLAIEKTKRVKSYYDWNQPGANRKDVIYYRGIKKLIEYLKTLSPQQRADFYSDAYFAKLSFEDITLVAQLQSELHISKKTSNIPFPLWKLILRKQNYVNPKTGNTVGAFLGDQNIKENLVGDDFRFLKLKPLTTEKKRQVINIMQYKEESKEYDNLKKDLETINSILRSGVNSTYSKDTFISPITQKLFIKRKNMEWKETIDHDTLERQDKSRGSFSFREILQKIGDEIEHILIKQLQ